MPLSPGRVQMRPARNATQPETKASKPDSTDAQQPLQQDGQLAYPRPAIQDHQAIVAQGPASLSASTVDAAAAPLTAAVDRLLKQPGHNNLQGYLVFDNKGVPGLIHGRPPEPGLSNPGQRDALCELFFAELAHRQPRGISQTERDTSEPRLRALATAHVNRTLAQSGNGLQLRGLMAALRELRAQAGAPDVGTNAPESKARADEPSPRKVAPESPPGPLAAAIERLKPGNVNQDHYIVFKNGQLALSQTKPPGVGMAKPEQQKALCDLIATELVHISSARHATDRDGEAFDAGARKVAKAIVERTLGHFGNHVQLSCLMAILPELATLSKLSASGLDTVIATMKDAARVSTQADVPEVSGPAHVKSDSKSGATKLLFALVTGVLVQFGLLRAYDTPGPARPGGAIRFTRKDMDDVIARAMQEGADLECAQPLVRMFDAIHGNPALSEHTITQANRIRSLLKLDGSLGERSAGAGPAAAALLLSLHPERLKQMFLTREQVYRLAQEAVVVLGHMGSFIERIANDGSNEFSKASPEDIPSVLYSMANTFMESPGGNLIASRFGSAIQILLHNAERLEAFADLDDALDEQLEGASESVFRLMQEYVPADFGNARRIDLHAQPQTGKPLLTQLEEPPVVLHMSPGQQQPETKASLAPPTTAAHIGGGAPARAASRTGSTQPQPQVGAPPDAASRFPGAKRRNPAEHFHPRDHRALSRDQLKQRQEVLEAREMDLIGAYDKWTPELRSLLKERSRARRMAEQGTANISSGGKLVQPTSLDR
jgi:hypothetical protein